jgi:hypothetical protein
LQSGKYKAKFDAQVPQLEYCDTEVSEDIILFDSH